MFSTMPRFSGLLLLLFVFCGVCLASTTTSSAKNTPQPQCVWKKRPYDFEGAWRRRIQEEARLKLQEERKREHLKRKEEIRKQQEERQKQQAQQQEERRKQQEARRKRQEEARRKQQEEARRRREEQQNRQRNRFAQQGKQPKDCPYKILGVARDATRAEIKKAFRTLSLKYHPDKVGPEMKNTTTDVFTKLVDAYEILGDEDRRAMYDNDSIGGYHSRPRNFNSKAGFYEGTSLIKPLNQTEFDRLVLCKGPFQDDEECVPWMVKFYTPWCVHSQKLIPEWKRTAFTMDGTETPLGFVRFGAVNCEVEKRLCNTQEIRFYPGIQLYAHDAMGQIHLEKYPRGKPRSVENLIEHAEKGIRLAHESILQPIDGFIMQKNVTNIDSIGLWIVMFENEKVACAQCGTLKAQLRRMSANIRGLANFGIFDCAKEPKVCQEQYVGNKYPILKLYPYKGSKGTGETLVKPGEDPLAALPLVEKVIRMCIANIEAEYALMKTLHDDYEEEQEEPPPPQPQYEYPKPEPPKQRVLSAGVRATAGAQYISSG